MFDGLPACLPGWLMLLAPLLAASSSNHSRQLNWFPCVEAGRCGTSVSILPDHDLIHYRGFVSMDRSQQKARFDRAPFGEGSVLQLISPATSISFRTNAHRVIVVLEYRGKRPCAADCPLVRTRPVSSKGLLDWGGCYEAKPCPNQCEVLLEIDGQSASGSWTNLTLLLMLPATQTLRLHLLGPGIMAERDGEKQELPRLHAADARAAPATVTLLRCADYGSFAEDARYCRPDLIVGLNAGLCAPEYCWETAVRRMIADRVPAIFTDYMRASCQMPLQLWGDLVQEHGGTILEPEVNPFRQPWSRPDDSNSDSSGRYTCMANGHIYGCRF